MLQKGAFLCALFSDCSADFFLSVGLGLGGTDTPEHRLRKSISCERTFTATTDSALLFQKLADIAESLSSDMQKESLWGRTLTLKLKTASFEVRTRAMSLPKYTNSKEDILMYGSRLLKAELPLSLRLMGLRVSQFRDDKHSSLDPAQKTLTKYFLPGDTISSNNNTVGTRMIDKDLVDDVEGDLSAHHDSSLNDGKLVLLDEKDNLLECSELAISNNSTSSTSEDGLKDKDDVCFLKSESNEKTDELKNLQDNETIGLCSQNGKPSWIDGYICSRCGIELPSSFEEERQEHTDYHLAEMLQEEEAMQNKRNLVKGRSLQKLYDASPSARKKQKASSGKGKHIPIDAFFIKGKSL